MAPTIFSKPGARERSTIENIVQRKISVSLSRFTELESLQENSRSAPSDQDKQKSAINLAVVHITPRLLDGDGGGGGASTSDSKPGTGKEESEIAERTSSDACSAPPLRPQSETHAIASASSNGGSKKVESDFPGRTNPNACSSQPRAQSEAHALASSSSNGDSKPERTEKDESDIVGRTSPEACSSHLQVQPEAHAIASASSNGGSKPGSEREESDIAETLQTSTDACTVQSEKHAISSGLSTFFSKVELDGDEFCDEGFEVREFELGEDDWKDFKKIMGPKAEFKPDAVVMVLSSSSSCSSLSSSCEEGDGLLLSLSDMAKTVVAAAMLQSWPVMTLLSDDCGEALGEEVRAYTGRTWPVFRDRKSLAKYVTAELPAVLRLRSLLRADVMSRVEQYKEINTALHFTKRAAVALIPFGVAAVNFAGIARLCSRMMHATGMMDDRESRNAASSVGMMTAGKLMALDSLGDVYQFAITATVLSDFAAAASLDLALQSLSVADVFLLGSVTLVTGAISAFGAYYTRSDLVETIAGFLANVQMMYLINPEMRRPVREEREGGGERESAPSGEEEGKKENKGALSWYPFWKGEEGERERGRGAEDESDKKEKESLSWSIFQKKAEGEEDKEREPLSWSFFQKKADVEDKDKEKEKDSLSWNLFQKKAEVVDKEKESGSWNVFQRKVEVEDEESKEKGRESEQDQSGKKGKEPLFWNLYGKKSEGEEGNREKESLLHS